MWVQMETVGLAIAVRSTVSRVVNAKPSGSSIMKTLFPCGLPLSPPAPHTVPGTTPMLSSSDWLKPQSTPEVPGVPSTHGSQNVAKPSSPPLGKRFLD